MINVCEMTARTFWKGESGITGTVEEDGRKYRVKLEVKGRQIHAYSCSCANGNSYKGMCSHCRALFAYYEEQADRGKEKAVYTSPEARTMIREYTNREVTRIIREDEVVQLGFEPRLILEQNEVRAEFRLGHDRLYMIKDLTAFKEALEQGAYVEYGKGLAFHHNGDAFVKEDRPLLNLVAELVGTYSECYSQFHKGSYASIPVIRQLNLSKSNRDRFFGLLVGRKIDVEDRRGARFRLMVTDQNPELQIHVRKAGRDGIRVYVGKEIFCFSGDSHLYVGNHENLYRCDGEFSHAVGEFLTQIVNKEPGSHEIELNDKDIPLFYERILKKMEPCCVIDSEGVDLEAYRPKPLKARFEFDSPDRLQLTLKPVLSYGEFSFHPVEDEKVPRHICRDVPGEYRISRLITRYFRFKEQDTDNLVIKDDEEAMYELLTRGLPEFEALGDVYLSDAFKSVRVLEPPQVRVGVNTAGDWLELTVDADGMSGADLAKILGEYRQKKKYYRLKSGEFIQLEDHGLMTLAQVMEGIAASKAGLQDKKLLLPRYRAFYLDSMLKETKGVTFYRDNLFKAVVRGMKSFEDNDFEVPAALAPVLRGYQKTGFFWLRTLDFYGFGGILADDMGLGKTVQVISLLLDESIKGERSPSLIVCPASLVYNWECEFRQFAPGLKILLMTGSAAEREEKIKSLKDYDVIVTSYDLLKRDIVLYRDIVFRFQVIDEAQYIKNAGTLSAKAVKAVRARTKFALTGTPVENRLSELWSIFDYLMPGFLFGYARFKKEFELPVVKDQDHEALDNLRRMTSPFILRRLKRDVLKDLPDKLETVVYSGFEKAQKELYTAAACRLKQQLECQEGVNGDKMQILAQLTRLRQICCDPALCFENYKKGSAKLETCMDLIKNGVSAGHKILLFSQFTSMLEIIGSRLVKEGITYYTLIGSTGKEERLKMVNSFQKDDTMVFLISLKAGGTGLNLTAADMVIHYDPWWNVAAQNQATDRTHRIGQKKQVTVFKLIMKDTIEENIMKLQESKRHLAEQVITGEIVSLNSLTREELMEMLS